MINSHINISFNERKFPLSQIPFIDEPKLKVLTRLLPEAPLPSFISRLTDRAERLSLTVQRLSDAQEHQIRDKILTFASVALLAGLIAGSVLGFYCSPAVGIPLSTISLLSLAGYATYCAFKCERLFVERNGLRKPRLVDGPALGAPFIIPFMLWSRRSSLQKREVKLRQAVIEDLKESLKYWRQDINAIDRVNRELNRSRIALQDMEQLLAMPSDTKNEIKKHIQLLEELLPEIEKGRNLAARFQVLN